MSQLGRFDSLTHGHPNGGNAAQTRLQGGRRELPSRVDSVPPTRLDQRRSAWRVRRFAPTTGRTTVGDGGHGRFCLSTPVGIAPAKGRFYRISVERKRNSAGTTPASDALLEGLNPAQRRAATYGIGVD